RGLPRNRGLPEEGDRGGRGLGANLLRRRTRGGERAAGSLPSPGLLRGPSAALLVGHMPTGMLPPRTLHPGPRRDDQALSGIRKARSGPACSLLVVATTAGPAVAAVERGLHRPEGLSHEPPRRSGGEGRRGGSRGSVLPRGSGSPSSSPAASRGRRSSLAPGRGFSRASPSPDSGRRRDVPGRRSRGRRRR